MQTVAEALIFSRQTEKLFSEDEKRELIDFLSENPLAGDEIPGTGGVRKVRFAASGRGERGGRGQDAGKAHTGANGPVDGHEPVGLPEVGTGPEARQRPRCGASAGDREGTGRGAAGVSGVNAVASCKRSREAGR